MANVRIISIVAFSLFTRGAFAQPVALELTLEKSIELALSAKGNLGIQIAAETIAGAESVYRQAESARKPVVDTFVSERNNVINFEAIGIRPDDKAFESLMLDRRVGPFSTFDARMAARYNLLDPSAKTYQNAAQAGVSVAEAKHEHARGKLAFLVARLYVTALRHRDQLDAVRSNIELSTEVVAAANRRLAAGTGDAIDVARANSQLADERYHLAAAQSAIDISDLRLLDAMGQPLDAVLELTDSLRSPEDGPDSTAYSTEQALNARLDVRAQTRQVEKARLDAAAIHSERLPTLGLFADYGALNTNANQPVMTHTVGFSLKIPLFDGGKRASRHQEIESRIRTEELRRKQLAATVDLQLRSARRRLELAKDQIELVSCL